MKAIMAAIGNTIVLLSIFGCHSQASHPVVEGAVLVPGQTQTGKQEVTHSPNLSPSEGRRDPRKWYDEAMKELRSSHDEYSRWCALSDAAKESVNVGHDADAKMFAEELERLAPKYINDWNYGNAIQDSNIVLGRLALKSGDLSSAKRRLLEAGRAPGSPQTETFGPNMELAKELLDKGERVVVLQYFELCRKSWEMHRDRLDQWRKDVEAGRIPDFGANLYY